MVSVRDVVAGVIVLCVTMMSVRGQSIVQGPVYYQTSGHRYYVVQAPTWAAAENAARGMGGHLATVEDAAESAWILSNLSASGTRKLFIGLNDAVVEGTFVWTSGSGSVYRNWGPGEPSSADYACLQSDGRWYARPESYTGYAVIEIEGPVRVPQELPMAQAFGYVSAGIGTNEIEIAEGDYTINGFISAAAPRSNIGVVRGAGVGRTIMRTASTTDIPLLLHGGWIVSGITFTGPDDRLESLLAVTDGTSWVTACSFETAGGRRSGGVVLASTAEVRLSGCRFVNLGQGVNLASAGCVARANNCEFRSVNIPVMSSVQGEFVGTNCTFAWSSPSDRVFRGVNLRTWLTNCVVWGASDVIADGVIGVRYTLAPSLIEGPGNIAADPRFVSGTDLRLAAGSPCIDAGDGLTYEGAPVDVGGGARVVDVAGVANATIVGIDLGCYEATEVGACTADFNRDGVKNSADFFDFLTAFFTCP